MLVGVSTCKLGVLDSIAGLSFWIKPCQELSAKIS
jgi:hypothetical protein